MSIQQKLHLKLGLKVHMTQSLQQAIKLLPLARLELATYLAQELQANPVLEDVAPTLEEEEEYDAEKEQQLAEEPPQQNSNENHIEDTFDYEAFFRDYFDLSYTPSYGTREITELPSFENTLATTTTLGDHLEWQLSLVIPPEPIYEIVLEIIGNLDDNGYLKTSLEEIAEGGNFQLRDVQKALDIVQHLDPVVVGST